MKNTAITGGLVTMFLAASMMASAYHVPNPHPVAQDWVNPGTGLVIVQCESIGPTDPINPLPVAVNGVGGLCYASSQHLETKAEKDAKKTNAQNEWGVVEPKCIGSLFDAQTGQPLNPQACVPGLGILGLGEEEKPSEGGGGDWFARVGSNTRSCSGEWGQGFVYKEAIAYYGGGGLNDNGVSGHATFFINEPDNFGTYNKNKFTVDPTDATKTFGDPGNPDDDNCTGKDVGLCDVTAKDLEQPRKIDACGSATEADKVSPIKS